MVVIQPVVQDGMIRRLVGLSIDLDWYNDLLVMDDSDVAVVTEAVLAVVDAEGTILARHPDPDKWVGFDASDFPHIQEMLAQRNGYAQRHEHRRR